MSSTAEVNSLFLSGVICTLRALVTHIRWVNLYFLLVFSKIITIKQRKENKQV